MTRNLMPDHKHDLRYDGKVIHSTDKSTIGLHSFVCDDDCGTTLYSERIGPVGKTIVRNDVRRYRNEKEKRANGK